MNTYSAHSARSRRSGLRPLSELLDEVMECLEDAAMLSEALAGFDGAGA